MRPGVKKNLAGVEGEELLAQGVAGQPKAQPQGGGAGLGQGRPLPCQQEDGEQALRQPFQLRHALPAVHRQQRPAQGGRGHSLSCVLTKGVFPSWLFN